jgi:EF hand
MEISMNLKTVLALAIAAACAAPLLAQQAGRSPDAKDNPAPPSAGAGATQGGFSAIDRNNDGYISRDEARDVPWSNRFSEMDKDNDGRLSLGEFDAMRQQGAAAGGSGDKPARKE